MNKQLIWFLPMIWSLCQLSLGCSRPRDESKPGGDAKAPPVKQAHLIKTSPKLTFERFANARTEKAFIALTGRIAQLDSDEATRLIQCDQQQAIEHVAPEQAAILQRTAPAGQSLRYCVLQNAAWFHSSPVSEIRAVFLNDRQLLVKFQLKLDSSPALISQLEERLGVSQKRSLARTTISGKETVSASLWLVNNTLWVLETTPNTLVLTLERTDMMARLPKLETAHGPSLKSLGLEGAVPTVDLDQIPDQMPTGDDSTQHPTAP